MGFSAQGSRGQMTDTTGASQDATSDGERNVPLTEIDTDWTRYLRHETAYRGQVAAIEDFKPASRSLSGQLAVERHEHRFSEAEIRDIVRDEVGEIVREVVEQDRSE